MRDLFHERSDLDLLRKSIVATVSFGSAAVAILRFVEGSPSPHFWIMTVVSLGLSIFLLRILRENKYIGFLNDDPDRLVRTAAALLKQSKHSLYYYGGVGLINTPGNTAWQDEFERKLMDKNFRLVRVINLQSATELCATYRASPDKLAEAVRQYLKWIRVHQNRFADRDASIRASNSIFTFAGAPIWQQGFHVIIFDEQHMLVVYRKDLHARAQLLMNRRELCRDSVAMIERLRSDLNMKEIVATDLDRIEMELSQYMKDHGIYEDDQNLPFHKGI